MISPMVFFVVDAAEERRRGETLPLGYALTVTEVAVRRRLVREARPVPHRRVRAAALQKSSAASSGQWRAVIERSPEIGAPLILVHEGRAPASR